MEILGSSKILSDGTNEEYNVSRSRVMRCYRYDANLTGTWLNENFRSFPLVFGRVQPNVCIENKYRNARGVAHSTMCNGYCAVWPRRCAVFQRVNPTHTSTVPHTAHTHTDTHKHYMRSPTALVLSLELLFNLIVAKDLLSFCKV